MTAVRVFWAKRYFKKKNPPKTFNRHLILHCAVQSKCQGFGGEIGAVLEAGRYRIKQRGSAGGGCDFSCLDVPTSSADKAVMRVKGDFEGGISSDKDI